MRRRSDVRRPIPPEQEQNGALAGEPIRKSLPGAAEAPLEEDLPGTVAYETATTTDTLNEVIQAVETRLRELNLGATCMVEMSFPEKPDSNWHRVLSYSKESGGWKLTIDEYNDLSVNINRSIDLRAASLDARMEAANLLPQLVSQLRETAHQRLTKLREAVEQAASALDYLNGDGEP